MRRICLDLCSGLGGFSKAFKEDKSWVVITVDNDPKFEPTVLADITKIDWLDFKQKKLSGMPPDVLLASPPCERFSVACHSWPRPGIQKAMEIVGSCFEAVAILKPKHWLIENPMGRLRWFLGKPPQTIRLCDYGSPYRKLTDLWGDIRLPFLQHQHKPIAYVETEGRMNAKKPLPRITNNRAKKAEMPYGLSKAILECVEVSGV